MDADKLTGRALLLLLLMVVFCAAFVLLGAAMLAYALRGIR